MQLAKWTQIVVALVLIGTMISSFFVLTLSLLSPLDLFQTIYMGLFGILILCVSFEIKVFQRNFLFMTTGVGKGIFDIFLGS